MLALSTGPEDVGTAFEAEQASRGNLDGLSSGLFKTVYVNPDRTTVYKVARVHSGSCEYAGSPQMAAEAAMSAKGLRNGTPGIPPVSVYMIDGRPILAMPFYDGDAPGDYDSYAYDKYEEFRAWSRLGIGDMHSDNWAWHDGRPMAIDLAAYGNVPGDASPETRAIADAESSTGDDGGDRYCEACEEDGEGYTPDGGCRDCLGCGAHKCDVHETVTSCSECPEDETEDETAEPPIAFGDLCGLATRMRVAQGGYVKGPTCGHPSRHPSRIVRTVDPSPERQICLWYDGPFGVNFGDPVWPDMLAEQERNA